MTRVVLTTPRAERDAAAIARWIGLVQGHPMNAARWLDGVEAAIASLAEHPHRCPLAPERPWFGREIRQLVHGAYRILFLIEDDAVTVLHIRHLKVG